MLLANLENLAVVCALVYLILAARESLWCWYFAFISSTLYTVIFWDVSLLMESLLNVFYMVMAVVGWWQWLPKQKANKALAAKEETSSIISLKLWHHLAIFFSVLLLALANGWFMQKYTNAAWPFVDSFTTWASIVTTFMVIYKILENWLYWIVIDGISIYLYLDKGLDKTALLFAAYVVIVVFGYFQWRKQYLIEQVS